MKPTRTDVSLRRAGLAFVVLAASLAYYRSLSFGGLTLGFVVGVPAFFIVCLVRHDQLWSIARCYTYAGLGALLFAGLLGPSLFGAVIGWAIAVLQNQYYRSCNSSPPDT
ncbi:hypothetical protein [Allorhodopirellula heiligendammensis]|uniref:hypothetical protein n=1 Tax=Allorhodopirellula heiligendammensis TaxID=2714739 RepID=UPI0011B6D1F0|nr:hypothetical protein [Allorhodopirellula heiligendammensis]